MKDRRVMNSESDIQNRAPHLDCAPSSEIGLSRSLAQRHGTLSLLNYAHSLTQASLPREAAMLARFWGS